MVQALLLPVGQNFTALGMFSEILQLELRWHHQSKTPNFPNAAVAATICHSHLVTRLENVLYMFRKWGDMLGLLSSPSSMAW
jgi:hypothetical protein